VMAKMRDIPIIDVFARNGRLRVDGRMEHDMYLYQVKASEESKSPGTITSSLKRYRLIRLSSPCRGAVARASSTRRSDQATTAEHDRQPRKPG
jgi:hypothetical protein